MIWLVTTALAQTTGQTASTATTADTSVGFVRTGLHDKIEACDLVVHAKVTASAGVTLQGGKRRWVQTLEILEVFHEDHSRTALSVGDSISFFTFHDDSLSATDVVTYNQAHRMGVAEDALYFLQEYSYDDSGGVTQQVWKAHRTRRHLNSFSTVAVGSVVAAIDYGGTTGEVAGIPPHGSSILRDDPDAYDWLIVPPDPARGLLDTRIDPTTVATNGMPWATYITRVRSAGGQL